MSHRIIVPLDRSSFAEEALPIAVEIARNKGSALDLVMVHRPLLPLVGSDDGIGAVLELDARIRADDETYLIGVAKRTATLSGRPATPVALDGPPAPTLIAYTEAHQPDAIVMSTHGRGGVNRLVLGSTADRLIRHLHVPILLVHPGQGATMVSRDPKLVLIPLDGSALAESAIDRAFDVFLPGDVVVRLVQVLLPMDGRLAPFAPEASPAVMAGAEQQLLRANRYVHAVATRLRERGINASGEVLVDPSPAKAILRQVEEHDCDLIALATRGSGGIERALLGSVADKVIRGATVPVLVTNPPTGASSRLLDTAVEPAAAAAATGRPGPAL